MPKNLTDQDRAQLGNVARRFGLPASTFQASDAAAALANLRALEAVRKEARRARRERP